jgi:hypothetical protein
VVAVAGLLGAAAAAVLAAEWARHRSVLAAFSAECRARPAAPRGPSLDVPAAGDQAEVS